MSEEAAVRFRALAARHRARLEAAQPEPLDAEYITAVVAHLHGVLSTHAIVDPVYAVGMGRQLLAVGLEVMTRGEQVLVMRHAAEVGPQPVATSNG